MINNKPTIIHLFSHKPNPICLKYKNPEEYIEKHDKADFIKINKYPFWIGFFQDFHHKMAIDVLNITDRYNHECWRPYWNFIKKKYEKVFDDVLHKVYPAKSIRIPKVGEWLWSESFLKDLKIRLKRKEKILLHIHDGHSKFITWLILKLKPLDIPVLYQHRGGWFSIFDYKHKRKNPVYLVNFKREVNMLKYITHYFSGSRIEYDFLFNEMKIRNMSFYMDGVDFDYFKPGDKFEARKKLNLPLDKKIILYVGRFDKTNGVNNLINTFCKLKHNNFNVELLLIGGYKNETSYEIAKNTGAILFERMHEYKLKEFYQASDLYVLAVDDYFYQTFGGFGSTPIQALACGIPVLSYNIMHLPAPIEEINKIGRVFYTGEDLYQHAAYMLNNLHKYDNCREIAKKYYDKKETIKSIIKKYEELFSKFY